MSPAPMKTVPSPMEDWKFNGSVLTPTDACYHKVMDYLQSAAQNDRSVKINFITKANEVSSSMFVHKALLSRLSDRFRSLLRGISCDGTFHPISLPVDYAHYFSAVEKLAYARPLDLSDYDLGLASFANNWQLLGLYDATLLSQLRCPTEKLLVDFVITHRVFLLTSTNVHAIKYHFARRFARDIQRLEAVFGRAEIWASCTYDSEGEDADRGYKEEEEVYEVDEGELRALREAVACPQQQRVDTDGDEIMGSAATERGPVRTTRNCGTSSKTTTLTPKQPPEHASGPSHSMGDAFEKNLLYLWKLFVSYGMLKEIFHQLCFFATVDRFSSLLAILCQLEDDLEDDDIEAMVYFLDGARVLQASRLHPEQVTFRVLQAAVQVCGATGQYEHVCEKYLCRIKWDRFHQRGHSAVLFSRELFGEEVIIARSEDDGVIVRINHNHSSSTNTSANGHSHSHSENNSQSRSRSRKHSHSQPHSNTSIPAAPQSAAAAPQHQYLLRAIEQPCDCVDFSESAAQYDATWKCARSNTVHPGAGGSGARSADLLLMDKDTAARFEERLGCPNCGLTICLLKYPAESTNKTVRWNDDKFDLTFAPDGAKQ